jgi:hypothetical protein
MANRQAIALAGILIGITGEFLCWDDGIGNGRATQVGIFASTREFGADADIRH